MFEIDVPGFGMVSLEHLLLHPKRLKATVRS
jgi:hypothetical protein